MRYIVSIQSIVIKLLRVIPLYSSVMISDIEYSVNNRNISDYTIPGVRLRYLKHSIDLADYDGIHLLIIMESGCCQLHGHERKFVLRPGYVAAITAGPFQRLEISGRHPSTTVGLLCCLDAGYIEDFHQRYHDIFDGGERAYSLGDRRDATLMPITSLLRAALFSLTYHFFNRCTNQEPLLTIKIDALLMSLLSEYPHYENHLLTLCKSELDDIKTRLKALLLEDLYTDTTINKIAEKGGFSPTLFKSLVKNHLGLPPRQWINKIKLEKSVAMLQDSNNSVAYVSQELGFESQSYFSLIFKRQFGVTPKKYQKCLNELKISPFEVV